MAGHRNYEELREKLRQEPGYQRGRELATLDLYDQGVISSGQAAASLDMTLQDFIALCDREGVAVLREPPGGIAAEVEAFGAWLDRHGKR